MKPDTLRQIPNKALDYLSNHDYDKNSFEKIIAEEGKNMILLSWIEHITENDILNIRNESERVALSLRLKSGNISSFYHDEIAEIIDEAQRTNETKKGLANYYLTMSDEERRFEEERFKVSYKKTPEKEKEWLLTVEEAEKEIKKLQKLEHLFWQTVEHWKAGIWRKPIPPFNGIMGVVSQVAKNAIELEDILSKNKSAKREKPSPRKIKEQNRKRNRRTIARLEQLTPKVVNAYQSLYDTGKYRVQEIFQILSKNSLKRFREKLTSGQLRGIYNRRQKFLQ